MSRVPVSAPHVDLERLLHDEEHNASPVVRRLRLLSVVVPVGVSVALLALAWVDGGFRLVSTLIVAAVAVFTALGKFAPLLGLGADSPLGVWEWAALVVYLDVTIATLLVLNLPVLYRIPRFGPTLEGLAEHGHHMLDQRPWLRRLTFAGVMLFVMFPLTGTGAVGGSIFGRLLGLGALRTWLAIALGAVLGTGIMAGFARAIAAILTPEVRSSWEFQAAGLAVVAAVIGVIAWRGNKVAKEMRARREARRRQVTAPG